METLGYGFNPDVSFSNDDPKHDHPLTPKEAKELEKRGIKTHKALLPVENVLAKSEHAANVRRWFNRLDSE